MVVTALRVLYPGDAVGPLLRLSAPISFWGGIDPNTGTVMDTRHPQRGRTVGGTILALSQPIGSSSSASVMLETIRNGCAPAGLILGKADAILVVGCLAAREIDLRPPPVLVLDAEDIRGLPEEGRLWIRDGVVSAAAR